jgi:drug/metabolite transporter (DMT)-like permease
LSVQGFSVGFGEMLVLVSAIFFAAHIIALSKWSPGRDAYVMTVVQLTVCALMAGIASIPEGYSAPPDRGVWAVVVFTAVFATAVAFIIQTWSQAHISATKVAVILTLQVLLGGGLVLLAMYLIVLKEEK